MPDKRRTEGSYSRLAVLAAGQHGVVSSRQLRELGYAHGTVAEWSGSGRLHRVHRGVYAVGHDRLTWHGRCFAAILACAPARASHASAAWLLGILRSRPGTFDLTAPTRRHAKPAVRIHYARLDTEDCATREDIPVTALPRTLLDLATTLPVAHLERTIERAEERRLLDLGPVERLLARAGHHPGAGKLRRALAIYREEPAFTRSGLERRFLALVREAGLPAPAMNQGVAGFEVDAYWRLERFAIELDVYETHGTRAAFERDRRRQEELKLVGVEMVRITGPRLDREPVQTMERVAALLAQRRRQLGDSRQGP
jgi:very-short-patch-repair endonuclease